MLTLIALRQSSIRHPKTMAISPYFSFINHSCEPNAHYDAFTGLPCQDGSQKIMYAIRKIKKGEEITISYWPFKNVSGRYETLLLGALGDE